MRGFSSHGRYLNNKQGLVSLVQRPPLELPVLGEGYVGLLHQHVRDVTQLAALLHQGSRRLAQPLCPAAYFLWQESAVIQMCAHAIGQILAAMRTQVRAAIEKV